MVWQGVPNLWAKVSQTLFQIFFDSILEFLDSVYIFLLLEIHHCKWENVFYEARISIIVSFENFNSQTTIVRNIHGAFHWHFN